MIDTHRTSFTFESSIFRHSERIKYHSVVKRKMKTESAIGDFCDNPFHGRLLMYPNHSLGIGIINSIMIQVTLLTNALLIFSLYKTDQLQSVSNYSILLLTVSDCAMGLVGQTLVSLLFTKYRKTSICKIETTTTCLTTFFGYLSGFSILSISINRCIHMIFLHRYKEFSSQLWDVSFLPA